MVKAVLAMSESTYRALCYRGAGCLSGVGTYLQGTVLQAVYVVSEPTCQNCVTVVQAVSAMSESTCRALCYSGTDYLSGVGTYLQGTVLHWCILLKPYRYLPAGHCITVMQTV